MRDIIGMQIRHGRQHGGNNPGGFFFSIGIPTVQISAGTYFHDNKNLLLAIKGFDRPDDLRMVERFKDGNFIFKFLHKRRIENPIQMDGFHFHSFRQVAVKVFGNKFNGIQLLITA